MSLGCREDEATVDCEACTACDCVLWEESIVWLGLASVAEKVVTDELEEGTEEGEEVEQETGAGEVRRGVDTKEEEEDLE